MKGIKRSVRKFGKPFGHKRGINGKELLNYISARKQIYLPSYAWVLQNKVIEVIELLKTKAEKSDLVLLDYVTNEDIENINKPLSHAALVKRFIEMKFPEIAQKKFSLPDQPKKKSNPKTIQARKKKNKQIIEEGQLILNFV